MVLRSISSLFVLALAATPSMGCALIAGLDEHELTSGASSSTGTSGAGSGGASGSGSGSSSGSGTGGGAQPGRWPDSATAVPCTNGLIVLPCPTPGLAGYGQDGNFALNVPNYSTNALAVTDSVTGLVWNANTAPNTMAWAAAPAYCDNLQDAGGDDWRLPSRLELISLLDMGKTDPKLPAAFPSVPASFPSEYWSSTKDAADAGAAWSVRLGGNGGAWTDATTELFTVRCVRTPPLASNQVLAGQTMEDRLTGLVWQRASQANLSWMEALNYCNSLNAMSYEGFTDWRLPNLKELHTIVDDTRMFPAIDTTVFFGNANDCFWSSTPDVNNPLGALLITFDDGFSDPMGTSSHCSARCVRGPDGTGG